MAALHLPGQREHPPSAQAARRRARAQEAQDRDRGGKTEAGGGRGGGNEEKTLLREAGAGYRAGEAAAGRETGARAEVDRHVAGRDGARVGHHPPVPRESAGEESDDPPSGRERRAGPGAVAGRQVRGIESERGLEDGCTVQHPGGARRETAQAPRSPQRGGGRAAAGGSAEERNDERRVYGRGEGGTGNRNHGRVPAGALRSGRGGTGGAGARGAGGTGRKSVRDDRERWF
mmetsp:Transcript_21511/g.54181  ORF Transcript_21511/g.54181 Transcript_21511/m.54181 type:complete len:232 (-) Transcript_21511:1911-2606(-)